MVKNVSKVIFKPDSMSTEEFTVIVDPDQYNKWKGGDTTIPLADVVDSFSVFSSAQGAQGLLGQPSKQQLDTVFGSHKDIDVVEQILKNGRLQAGTFQSNSFQTTNASRGTANERR